MRTNSIGHEKVLEIVDADVSNPMMGDMISVDDKKANDYAYDINSLGIDVISVTETRTSDKTVPNNDVREENGLTIDLNNQGNTIAIATPF